MEIIAAFVAGALLGAGRYVETGGQRAAEKSTETDVLENDNVFKPFIEGGAGKTY